MLCFGLVRIFPAEGFAESSQRAPVIFAVCGLVDEKEKIRLAAFKKGAGLFLARLSAGGEKERKTFICYSKRNTCLDFFQNTADGILTTELAGKIIIQSAAVQKNNVRGGGKLLPAKLSAQQCQIAAKVTAAECM